MQKVALYEAWYKNTMFFQPALYESTVQDTVHTISYIGKRNGQNCVESNKDVLLFCCFHACQTYPDMNMLFLFRLVQCIIGCKLNIDTLAKPLLRCMSCT